MTYKLLLSSTLVILLTACGSDDKSTEQQTSLPPTPSVTTLTGVFLDSAVKGLNYKTASQSGQTNELGEFSFQADEMITFSIGAIELPSTLAALYITPLEVYQTNNINQIEVVNLLRLLQSLDLDGDASNGIEITESVHQLAANLSIDFSATDFEQQIAELISLSGAANQELVPVTMAIEHFQLTLNQISNDNLTRCTTTHGKIGHSGFFNTFHHNVSGKATIIDDCTIEITQFSYDGGGPDVYFYGAIDHQYAESAAFAIGQQINGQSYDNASITLKLPQNKSLDDLNGLSVWCVDFSANFGQMEFTQ
ncbi:DM13 domain-containing protein [Colwellia psychrerythraea]|uniref:Electron transfer DM13 n=1 Tax=Colwellia psychrerythraea TaxID=28229 RepID=A0A099L5F0_COLPS|nr:DM13 domain-containing protein [Colwellia psychrerythraea]KGJ97630.1 Electron transfer DM13 [Colwellia psychrerythraea]